MSIIIKEFKSSLQLRPYVELFWLGSFNINSVSYLSQKVIPNGYVELIIHLSDCHCELLQNSGYSSSPNYLMIGLFTQPYNVHFKKRVKVFGIRFKPEAIYHIFGIPASELSAYFADAECVAGKSFHEFTLRIMDSKSAAEMISISEKYLLKNISESKLNLYYLNKSVEIIRKHKGILSMDELAGKVYISTRQIERDLNRKLEYLLKVI